MIDLETPHHQLPGPLRQEIEEKVTKVGRRTLDDLNTPHPDNPNMPKAIPNGDAIREEIKRIKQATIHKWNSKLPPEA